jgi:hypothetical protein
MRKPAKTFADYLVVAISPILIMLLVGSLAFFLIQVLYRDEMVQGVRWVTFWFVFAIVLVSRIGIEQSKEHAIFYGVALAAATWVYLLYLHSTPMVGAILLALTWWCAHKLTVDCTLINEEDDKSGEGVLSGLWRELERTLEPPAARPVSGKTLPQLPPSMILPPRPKPTRPPGRWVVYFSLAALPLFGIGQLFLPANNPEARRMGFEFLAVYLAAALSLLITTSFLGMRRYLRQRFVEMPASIAIGWVRFGALLAVVVLILALVLPRPGSKNTVRDLAYRVTNKKHNASDYGLPFNPTGEGTGAPSDQPTPPTSTSTDSKKTTSGGGASNDQNPNQKSGNSGAGGGGSGGQGGQGGQSGSGGSSGGGKASGGGGGSGNTAPPQRSGKIPGGDQSPNGAESDGGNGRVKAEDDGKDPEPGNGNGQSAPGQPGQGSHPQKTPDKKRPVTPIEQKPIPQPENKPGPKEEHHLDWQRFLRILLFVALGTLFIWFVVRYRRAIAHGIRSFMAAVMKFFRDLFQLRRRKQTTTIKQPLPAPPPRPFGAFENPFLTRKDKSWPPERLILYTYEAIRAWAKEQRIEIKPQETPREFCLRLTTSFPEFGLELERFSLFYSYVAFAQQVPPDFEPELIHRLWQYMGDSVMAISSR